jgi:hypothetical protein
MTILLADAAEMLKFETALLLLVTAGLLILAKMVSDLRSQVRNMRKGGSASPPVSAPAPGNDIPPDVFAAIVSAVYFTLGENHHIVSVNPSKSLAWSREGRRSIFRSHTFR